MDAIHMDTSRQTALKIDLGGEQILLERIEAAEGFSTPFDITLDVISPLGEIDLLPHLGNPATVTLSQDDELQRYFHGYVVEGEYSRETSEGFHYQLKLRPWTYFLSNNSEYRIFQEMTALAIIQEVLGKSSMTHADYSGVGRPGSKREYCVQYGESDFAFVSRLMEEEGIYYFFKHKEDRHVLHLSDRPSAHEHGHPKKLSYNPHTLTVFNTDSAARTQSNRQFYLQSWMERVTTAGQKTHTTRDFDFKKPETPVEASVEASHKVEDKVPLPQEVYRYPGGYIESSVGKELGEAALFSLNAQRSTYRGQSQSSGLSCGTKVEVSDHPNGRMNSSYLITRTFHSITAERYRSGGGTGEESYNVLFEAVPADTYWRAPQVTPRPIVHGLETAIISGPDGEEIFTDEYGRVKVRFPWDRSDTPGSRSTCWMRVSQTGGLGNIILPRVGHEVLVDFLNGDPDRPVVVGRVFNASHMPIYALPEHKTRALWRTKRYGATGSYGQAKSLDTGAPGANELRFEDKGGQEEIFLHAERDMNTRIRHIESHHVGLKQEIDIGRDRIEVVGNDESVTIKHDRMTKVENDDKLDVTSNIKVWAGSKIDIEAVAGITLTCGSSTIKIEPASIKIDSPMINITAKAMLEAKSPMTTVKGDATLILKGGITMIN